MSNSETIHFFDQNRDEWETLLNPSVSSTEKDDEPYNPTIDEYAEGTSFSEYSKE